LVGLVAMLAWGPRVMADAPFIVDSWGTADGLPQSSVIAVTQTRDGYLWLGTLNGLVRFDGNAFTRFNVNNTPGLPDNRIVFLFEDRRTNLWVGTENGGLCVIQNGRVRDFATGGEVEKIIYAYEDETGGIWFCVKGGHLFHWKDDRLDLNPPVPVEFWQQLFHRAFHLVVPRRAGDFWHLENNRLVKWGDDKPEKDFSVCPWPPAIVMTIFPDVKIPLTFDAHVTAAGEDRDGNLVVGTRAGIYWGDGQGGWRHIMLGDNSFVLSVCFDGEGNLWAGTDGGGLYRVQKNYFAPLAGLPGGVAKSVAEDARGGLWVAFNAQGLVYSLAGQITNFGIGQGSNAWSVLVDRQQQVWAGTRDEGLFRLMDGRFQEVPAAGTIGRQIFALFQGRDGLLWVGGENGLGVYDGQNWKFFSARDGLPPNGVRALADDPQGNLWIGTEGGGLFLLRDGKISPVRAPFKDVSCLWMDRDGVLWAGTFGHGLAWLAQGQWTGCSAAEGLASDDIGSLIEDDSGNLWIGSYEGLMRVGKKSLADFAGNHDRKISCRTFLTRECSAGAQPAALRTHDGRLLFPTTAGLVALDQGDLKPNTNPPPIVIESVSIDGVPQKNNPLSSVWPGTVTLAPENEQLEIHFTALDFSAPKRARLAVQFQYKLEGYDKNWTDAGDARVAHFPKLPHGQYVFHVKAGNEDGVWNEAGATLAVIVQPPFWRQPWFVGLAILFLLGALAGTIYLISTAKLKRELRELHQKELLEKERARIARDLHDQLGANLTQVTLLGEMAEADKALPGEVEQHAQQICATARETTRALDEIVWAVNPANDTLEGLVNYACKYAQDYFALAGVSYRAELPAGLTPVPILPEVRHNVFLAFKEAVNNVVKHAQATEAHVKLQLEPGQFILSVADNGRGLGDLSGKTLRNGLKNMRRRLADVQGEFDITPQEHGGTVVRLIVPLIKK
jgi:signal transduction histidine kinase/ligand-binding sensor domain-containing protein